MTSIVRRGAALPEGLRTVPRSPVWMLDQLPTGLLKDEFFVRFVSIFQELGETILADVDNVENLVDVNVAPEAMVRWLGSWIGVDDIDADLPSELQRRIVESAADTLVWRGTARGLRRFLELVSGGDVEVEDGGGVWRAGEVPHDTAWVRMRVQSTGWLPEGDFATLIRDEVPAHVYAELWLGDRLLWNSDVESAHE
jgi:phage tail-like protein